VGQMCTQYAVPLMVIVGSVKPPQAMSSYQERLFCSHFIHLQQDDDVKMQKEIHHFSMDTMKKTRARLFLAGQRIAEGLKKNFSIVNHRQ